VALFGHHPLVIGFGLRMHVSSKSNSDSYTVADRNSCAQGYPDPYPHSRPPCYTNSYSYSHPCSNTWSDTHAHPDTCARAYANGYIYSSCCSLEQPVRHHWLG